jgi:transcriptional regulator with XRE-family HTH domain
VGNSAKLTENGSSIERYLKSVDV